MSHAHKGDSSSYNNYNILFCTSNNKHESPVRDYHHQSLFKKEEDQQSYKDYYGVSNFKFPEVRTNAYRKNHTNFCELSFDGTKSKKHHHRRNNTIKRVTSATTINCREVRQKTFASKEKKMAKEEEEQVIEKTKDTMTFHYLAEQFKKKLKFIETPVKLHRHTASKHNASTFEVILSPKSPNSYTSIETMSNILQSSEHIRKQIILTSKTFHSPPNKPDVRDREIQTAIIGIRNLNTIDECFNMSLASVNDIFYNMDLLPVNEELLRLQQRKRKKLNLTMTHLPCVEIKCSSVLFEMPAANTQRPQMPRRTINSNKSSVNDYHHEATNIQAKVFEPVNVAVSSSETNDNLKNKIFGLFNDTQISASEDFPKKVNDLCAIISSLLSENNKKSRNDMKNENPVTVPGEIFINISKIDADDKSRESTLNIPYIQDKSASNPSTPQHESRSESPPSRPSSPSRRLSRISVTKSNNEIIETSARSTCNVSRLDSSPNTSFFMPNHHKFSFISTPSASTLSSKSCSPKRVVEEEADGKHTTQLGKPVPRNVFLIPPHVNEILKRIDHNSKSNLRKEFGEYNSPSANSGIRQPQKQCNPKKTFTEQSWIVPDFMNKPQLKCDAGKKVESAKTSKKSEHDICGPSVTFSSMVDIFGGDDDCIKKQVCSVPNPQILKNTLCPVTVLKKSKTYPDKPELYATNHDKEETNLQNYGLFTVRQAEYKPKPILEKQSSFYNSNLGIGATKKDTNTVSCLQKRKDYDNKLKMQLQKQNKNASKIPLPTVVEQQNNVVKNKTPTEIASKLPILNIRNEGINNNKPLVCRTNVPGCSKLFSTDIKDTPFSKLFTENTPRKQQESLLPKPRPTNSILKNTQKSVETNVNVTKDVSSSTIEDSKEIIFIKHPVHNFHKIRNKFKVDTENVDNSLFRPICKIEKHKNNEENIVAGNSKSTKSAKSNYSNMLGAENSALLKIIDKLKNEKLRNQYSSFPSHQNIFVYRSKDKPFSNVHKKDSVTKWKKMLKLNRNNNTLCSKVHEDTLAVDVDDGDDVDIDDNDVNDDNDSVSRTNSLDQMKPKIHRVTFAEPNQWASLYRVKQCRNRACVGEKRRQQTHKVCKKKLPKKSTIRKSRKDSKLSLGKKSEKTFLKSYCDNFAYGCGLCKKKKEDKSTDTFDIKRGDKCCGCKSSSHKRKHSKATPSSTSEYSITFGQLADNLIACCTTLCCNVHKNDACRSVETIPKQKLFPKACKCNQTHYLYVKPSKMKSTKSKMKPSRMHKIFRMNSSYRKSSSICLVSISSRSALTKRKKLSPAWKFKELIYNKFPNDLSNIIKCIKNKTFPNNFNFLHLPISEQTNKELNKTFPIPENPEEPKLSTIRIGDSIEKVPNSIRNIKVVNKGRFTKKINDPLESRQSTPRNIKHIRQQASIRLNKIEDTVYVPNSPRKIFLSPRKDQVKGEYLLFPSKHVDAINPIPTFTRVKEPSSTKPITKQNTPTFPFPWLRNSTTSAEKTEDSSQTKSVDINEESVSSEETVQKNNFEDRPILTFTSEELDVNDRKLLASESPKRRTREFYPVKLNTVTRKLFENRPKVFISPRQLNREMHNVPKQKFNRLDISKAKYQSNETEGSSKMEELDSMSSSTAKMQINPNKKQNVPLITKIKDKAKLTKLPVLKTRRTSNDVNTKFLTPESFIDGKTILDDTRTKTDEKKERYVTTRKRQMSKLVIEFNEIVHIPDDDELIIPLKNKESVGSKLTDYKSVIALSGLSSNSQLSISSSSKKASSNSRTLLNIIGNFFRGYSKKVKKKKSKLIDENG